MLLVEGVAGIGKTTLINSLIRQYVKSNKRIRSLLHLTQAHTYHPLAPEGIDRELLPEQNIAHLEQILDLLNWMVSSVSDEQRKMFFCTMDTLHITHCFRPGILNWSEVTTFDRRLHELGCKLIFLRATEETIWERTVWGRRDNEFITYYGRKYGDSLDSIHRYHVQEQEKMMAIAEMSAMEKLVIDCEGDISDTSQEALDFWMS